MNRFCLIRRNLVRLYLVGQENNMRNAWKVYFYTVLAFFIGGVVLACYAALALPAYVSTRQFGENMGTMLVGFIGLVGLYGFVFKKPILHAHIWKVVALGYLAYTLYPFLEKPLALGGAPPVALGILLAIFLFSLPQII